MQWSSRTISGTRSLVHLSVAEGHTCTHRWQWRQRSWSMFICRGSLFMAFCLDDSQIYSAKNLFSIAQAQVVLPVPVPNGFSTVLSLYKYTLYPSSTYISIDLQYLITFLYPSGLLSCIGILVGKLFLYLLGTLAISLYLGSPISEYCSRCLFVLVWFSTIFVKLSYCLFFFSCSSLFCIILPPISLFDNIIATMYIFMNAFLVSISGFWFQNNPWQFF